MEAKSHALAEGQVVEAMRMLLDELAGDGITNATIEHAWDVLALDEGGAARELLVRAVREAEGEGITEATALAMGSHVAERLTSSASSERIGFYLAQKGDRVVAAEVLQAILQGAPHATIFPIGEAARAVSWRFDATGRLDWSFARNRLHVPRAQRVDDLAHLEGAEDPKAAGKVARRLQVIASHLQVVFSVTAGDEADRGALWLSALLGINGVAVVDDHGRTNLGVRHV